MSHFNLTCAQNKGPSTTRLFSKFHSYTRNFIRCNRVRRVFGPQTEQEKAKYIVSPHFQNFLPLMQQPNVGHGCLILEVSRSHTHARAVGRTPLDEQSARRRDLYLTTQHSQQTGTHAPGGIRNPNPSKQSAADPRPRPIGHWDRQIQISCIKFWEQMHLQCTLPINWLFDTKRAFTHLQQRRNKHIDFLISPQPFNNIWQFCTTVTINVTVFCSDTCSLVNKC
jgi:hypothetical protein